MMLMLMIGNPDGESTACCCTDKFLYILCRMQLNPEFHFSSPLNLYKFLFFLYNGQRAYPPSTIGKSNICITLYQYKILFQVVYWTIITINTLSIWWNSQ